MKLLSLVKFNLKEVLKEEKLSRQVGREMSDSAILVTGVVFQKLRGEIEQVQQKGGKPSAYESWMEYFMSITLTERLNQENKNNGQSKESNAPRKRSNSRG